MALTKALIAGLLIVSPATLGIAAYTGAIDLALDQGDDLSPFGGEVVQEFEKTFEAPLATGELDLRIDDGAVRVVGWEENAYHVVVLQEAGGDQAMSDYETAIDFQDHSEGDHLNLSIIVDRQGTYSVNQEGTGVSTGDHVEVAVVAFVPSQVHFDVVFACTGQVGWWSETLSTLPGLRIGDSDGCVPAEESPDLAGNIHLNTGSSDGLNVTSGAEGLQGDLLKVRSDHGSIAASDLVFSKVDLETDHGNVAVSTVEADEIELDSEYGNIALEDATAEALDVDTEHGNIALDGAFGEADIGSEYGNIHVTGVLDSADVDTEHGNIKAELDPRTSGELAFDSEYGNIGIVVPTTDSHAYDLEAITDYGNVRISLADVETEDHGDEDESGEHVSARTVGYDSRPIQVVIASETEHGNIKIVDTALPGDDEEDDDGARAPEHPEEPRGPEGSELLEVPTPPSPPSPASAPSMTGPV